MKNADALHIAIIPDGNRRWANERGLKPWKGHEAAKKTIQHLGDFCRDDPRVKVFTMWFFSTENWNRDSEEIDQLMKIITDMLRDQRKEFQKHGTRFVHSGRKDRIPVELKELIQDAEEETKDFTNFTVHLALDYGGKDEVLRAINALLPVKEMTEESLRSHFDHPELPDIDLIIRTSGEKRTSNFFLWQSAYSEWEFSEKYFPDFTIDDLKAALDDYAQRKRRFGS